MSERTVLHVRVVSNAGGGPDKTILRSARHLREAGYRVAAAYIHPADSDDFATIESHAKQLDCPIFGLPERGPLDLRTVFRLLRICRELNVTIWHGHDYKSDVLGVVLRPMHAMKLVTTVHGFTGETWRTRLYTHVDNLALRGYDAVAAVSPTLIQHCSRRGVHPRRLHYVPNAIDLHEYRRTRSREDARTQLGIARDTFVIGVVGRLSPEKGVDRAVRTLPAIRAVRHDAQLHVVGDGTQRNALQRLAARCGVADAVRWWGWQQDARPWYEAFDLLLLPSYTEGLPNAVLEAMAMDVPVAATNVGGVNDLLDNGRCGLLLEADESRWPEQLIPLLIDAGLRDELAAAARQRVAEHFSFDSRMAHMRGIYEETLAA